MVYGPIAAYLVEAFPARIRYTAMSLPYHIGNGVFGGLLPLIGLSIIARTGNIYAGLYYPDRRRGDDVRRRIGPAERDAPRQDLDGSARVEEMRQRGKGTKRQCGCTRASFAPLPLCPFAPLPLCPFAPLPHFFCVLVRPL